MQICKYVCMRTYNTKTIHADMYVCMYVLGLCVDLLVYMYISSCL